MSHTPDEPRGGGSRPEAPQRAARLLRAQELSQHYAAAFTEWASGDGDVWDAVVADGLGPD